MSKPTDTPHPPQPGHGDAGQAAQDEAHDQHDQDALDEALDETFPASDPVAVQVDPARRRPPPDRPG